MDQGWAMVIAGVVAAVPGVISTIMSVRTRTAVRGVADDAAAVKAEVKNSHAKNLREESDERHDDLMTQLGTIRTVQEEQGGEIRGLRADVRRISTDQTEDRGRIRDLEKHPRRSRNGNENDREHQP